MNVQQFKQFLTFFSKCTEQLLVWLLFYIIIAHVWRWTTWELLPSEAKICPSRHGWIPHLGGCMSGGTVPVIREYMLPAFFFKANCEQSQMGNATPELKWFYYSSSDSWSDLLFSSLFSPHKSVWIVYCYVIFKFILKRTISKALMTCWKMLVTEN